MSCALFSSLTRDLEHFQQKGEMSGFQFIPACHTMFIKPLSLHNPTHLLSPSGLETRPQHTYLYGKAGTWGLEHQKTALFLCTFTDDYTYSPAFQEKKIGKPVPFSFGCLCYSTYQLGRKTPAEQKSSLTHDERILQPLHAGAADPANEKTWIQTDKNCLGSHTTCHEITACSFPVVLPEG